MRIVHISSYELRGGAARAANRLHEGLLRAGIESHMLVGRRESTLPTTHGPQGIAGRVEASLRRRMDQAGIRYSQSGKAGLFSAARVPDRIRSRLAQLNPDVVNIHWINHGFMALETLHDLIYPVVWTMHDMWAFTGGCHYSSDCRRYESECGSCPMLLDGRMEDLSRNTWRRKRRALSDHHVRFVSPSAWLAGCARHSSLLKNSPVRVIPYGLDLEIFSPQPTSAARIRFQIPQTKTVALFGAATGTEDMRKGFDLLEKALLDLSHRSDLAGKLCLVIFGGRKIVRESMHGFECIHVGQIHADADMAMLYSAADVFIAPSREDNLPNTVIEASACGIPSIAFRVGGFPELIDDGKTGWLVEPFSTVGLADAVYSVVNSAGHKLQLMRVAVRNSARDRYRLSLQTDAYVQLYREVLDGRGEPVTQKLV